MGLGEAKPVNTLLEQNQKLTSIEYDESAQIKTDGDEVISNVTVYQRLLGRLLYLTDTRPDIMFAVQHLSQFMHKPKKSHLEAAFRVVRYIKKNPGRGILLSANSKLQSVTGFCVKIRDSLVSWKSKKQTMVFRSSAEAEYRSMVAAVAETVWMSDLLKEICPTQLDKSILLSDSRAALQIEQILSFMNAPSI
ncbi:hypothetical protein V6Z11_A11G210800, partial [Gossypium hirsutum]